LSRWVNWIAPTALGPVKEFGRGVPQPCLTTRIVCERLDFALFVFHDKCAVPQVRPPVVEDDRCEALAIVLGTQALVD
jgi:hypothetical protein